MIRHADRRQLLGDLAAQYQGHRLRPRRTCCALSRRWRRPMLPLWRVAERNRSR
jgi:hypothetical protein